MQQHSAGTITTEGVRYKIDVGCVHDAFHSCGRTPLPSTYLHTNTIKTLLNFKTTPFASWNRCYPILRIPCLRVILGPGPQANMITLHPLRAV
jgi:hypothetical protein